MTFFSRPNLEDIQFKQTPDSELSLSGITRIKTWSGLTLSDGTGGDVPITATGATQGHVLTFLDGVISLQASSASGGTTIFNTDRITTRSGIPAVNVGGECTINNFLEGYFFPSVPPSSAISIATGGSNREFGNSAVGNLSFSGIRETNPICLIAVNDNAINGYNNIVVSSDIPGDYNGTLAYTYPNNCASPPAGTASNSVTFGVCVETNANEVSTKATSITWRNRKFILKSNTLYNDNSITPALTGGELSTTKTKTINDSFSNEFFYYVYPKSFGTPTVSVNGLPNSAWGNLATGTLYEMSYVNTFGYVNDYYVMRSDNRITGSYNIVIS